jgi:hypothetical protein
MEGILQLPATATTLLVAAAAIACGGALFARGLEAQRRRMVAARLAPAPLTAATRGPACTRGRVALEGPMFAPLSHLACAGWVLEVSAGGPGLVGRIESRPSFRLVGEGTSARVDPGTDGRFEPAVTARRILAAGEPVGPVLAAVIERDPVARWLRGRGEVAVVERALRPGDLVHVLGSVREVVRLATAAEVQFAATGTDGPVVTDDEVGYAAGEARLAIGAEERVRLEVFATEPDPLALAPPAWQVALAVAGPLLSLAGLLALAALAQRDLAGRF